MSKPLHPATVHFPLAFLLLGYGLDLYHVASPHLPANLTAAMPPAADLTRASYYLIFLGLATFVPAIASGGVQAIALFRKQGLYDADGKALKDKVKATLTHALTMDAVFAAGAYAWYQRRTAATATLAGQLRVGSLSTPEAAFAPAPWMVAVEAGLALVLAFSASVGGKLTYNYGVGFQSLSAGSKKKQ